VLCYRVAGSRFCARIGRPHKSNQIYFVADLLHGVVYQKCFDPDCYEYRSEPWRLPPVPTQPQPQPQPPLDPAMEAALWDVPLDGLPPLPPQLVAADSIAEGEDELCWALLQAHPEL